MRRRGDSTTRPVRDVGGRGVGQVGTSATPTRSTGKLRVRFPTPEPLLRTWVGGEHRVDLCVTLAAKGFARIEMPVDNHVGDVSDLAPRAPVEEVELAQQLGPVGV